MLNSKEIQNQLVHQLTNTGWEKRLEMFLKSLTMEDILLSLYTDIESGRRFTPPLKSILTPFVLCPYEATKVVLLYPEPWNDPTICQGLPISHTGSTNHRYETSALHKDLSKYVPNHRMVSGDILYWASEGILMLNTTFTTQILKSGRHFEIWKPLIFRLFEIFNERTDLIYLVFGENSYTRFIKGEIVRVDMLPKERNQVWDSGNMYDKINTLLAQKNKSKIIW